MKTNNACESFSLFFFNNIFSHISPPFTKNTWLSVINGIRTEVYIKLNSVNLQMFPNGKNVNRNLHYENVDNKCYNILKRKGKAVL